MDFVVFDTETTGLLGSGGHEVIQFSALWVDEDFVIRRVVNRYCKSNQFVSEGALKVHGLTDKIVDVLSDGKYFEQVVEEEGLRDLDDVTWISYGASFDMGICNQTLVQNGVPPINFGKLVRTLSFDRKGVFNFCALDTLGRMASNRGSRTKLVKVIDKYLGIEKFKSVCSFFRSKYNVVNPHLSEGGEEDFFHNAVFDALGVCLLLEVCKVPLFE